MKNGLGIYKCHGNWNGSGTGPVARSHHRATGPVPEPFHCDHIARVIARWSARSGTTGRSGTGVNTGARLVPVPKLWCEHGLSLLMPNIGNPDIFSNA